MDNPFTDKEEAGIAEVREQAFAAVPNNECRSLREAKESNEWLEWECAIQAELNQLQRMGTWKLVEKPPDVELIGNKFVFAKKRDKDRTLIKHKARLIAKGCAQRPGFNYFEMHAPVVCLETIRAILAIAPTRKLYIQQLDVKGAYLNGKLTERMYMKQPEGYDDRTRRVCQLIKTLYSLKQARREWNIELDTKLRKKGYMRLRSDPCIYIWRAGDDFAIIAVWVDDMLMFAMTITLRDKTKADIKSEWEIMDLGVPTKIVRIELTISPDKIFISLSKYIKSILLREGLGRSNPVSTPLDLNVTLVPNPDGNSGDCSNAFASLLGELQYIVIATCLDISYTVNRLASYTTNPSLQHHTALKRILQYLSGTRSYGITYKAVEDRPDFFHGYANAAYANADDYKLTSGYVFLAGEGAITWSLKKQISTASSSTHAEYVALSEASREACWLRNLYCHRHKMCSNKSTRSSDLCS